MDKLQQIQNNGVYKEVLSDSFGGVMYNIANQGKYDATEILTIWESLIEL